MSSELVRRAAPALAITGAALATVVLFDPAVLGQGATGGSSATSSQESESGEPESEESESEESDSCGDASELRGEAISTRFGPVQVAARVSGGTLCSVFAIDYPDSDHESAQINARAIPVLDEQASRVGVDFDAVSGATYTSEGYRTSLQSILDQL